MTTTELAPAAQGGTHEYTPAPLPKVTKRAIFTIGDKGGTSKSFIARLIAEILRKHLAGRESGAPRKLMLVDGDASVGSLAQYFALRDAGGTPLANQGADGVELFELHGTLKARNRFADYLIEQGAETILCDLPATSLTMLRQITDHDFFGTIAEKGYKITIVSPVTPYRPSILDLKDAIALIDPEANATFEQIVDLGLHSNALIEAKKKLKPRAKFIAAVNLGSNAEDRDDFFLWDAPDCYTRALLDFVGGTEVEIPRLRAAVASKLDIYSLTFAAGETAAQLTNTERSALVRWNKNAEKALAPAFPFLGL